MDKVELKIGIHSFIDQIDNIELLKEYYADLRKIIQSGKSQVWDSLTEKERREVLLSYDESSNEENLVDENVVMEKYQKWLKK